MGPRPILSYMQRVRVPVHTLSTWNCYSYLWPWMCICGQDESLKTLETVPSISSHKPPSDKGSSSILVVQGELMETEIWQCFLGSLQGKFISSSLTPFLALITVSLDSVFLCVCLSNHLWVPSRQGMSHFYLYLSKVSNRVAGKHPWIG